MKAKARKLNVPKGKRVCPVCGGHGKVAPGQTQRTSGRIRVILTPKGAVTCATCGGKGWV